MASTFLTQALLTIPGNPNLCPPAKSGFSAAVSGRLSSCCRVSTSRVSLSPVVAAPTRRRSFVVRAEEEAAAENAEVVAEEATEAEEEAESEAVAVEEKPPRKPYVKLGDVMGILNKRAIEARDGERPIPDIRVGDIVQIVKQVPTRRRNVAKYKGIVISRQNAGIHTTIRIRRIIAGVGVEIVFALYSPLIKEIIVIRHRKVRRAKLYYLRDKLPRFSTFK